MTEENAGRWWDAVRIAEIFAVDSHAAGGVRLQARAGPARDAWLALTQRMCQGSGPFRRCPVDCPDDRLLGGLDLSATLAAGRPVVERGLLADVDGGVLVLAGAERLEPARFARIASAFDRGTVMIARDGVAACHDSRFGMIALDECAADDEVPPSALLDRLGIWINLEGVRPGQADPDEDLHRRIAQARALRPLVKISADTIELICRAAEALGVASLRAPGHAAAVARSLAALAGRVDVDREDVSLAVRFVLGPRATRVPVEPEAKDDQPTPEPSPRPEPQEPAANPASDPEQKADISALDDDLNMVLAAAVAALPAGVLALLASKSAAPAGLKSGGRAGKACLSRGRGRPAGARQGRTRDRRNLALIDTLRAAAPWQKLRREGVRARAAGDHRIEVRSSDFRIRKLKHRSESATIFVVDASGSQALHRLAEVKGAVEIILADCYQRRDSVALIAFRGRDAELLLAPTRSLTRARRRIEGLPGGGGTPLAAALDAARELAAAVQRKGQWPSIVLLTDGRANVARDGQTGRQAAILDALEAAAELGASRMTSLLIDTSPHRNPEAERLATVMGARYVALPHANAQTLSTTVRSVTTTGSVGRGMAAR